MWTEKAIETLAEIMTDPKVRSSARVAAANALLDRGHGRAPQTVKVEQITEMADHELKAYIGQLRAELGIADEDAADADKPKRLH